MRNALSMFALVVACHSIAGAELPLGPAVISSTARPSTTDNDDSCDIALLPAATLLLPYFRVDVNAPPTAAQTTLFTVTNVTQVPQVVRATVWTDWAFPVLSFNIFLTGYDVQSINLYDVLVRGRIAPDAGTSITVRKGERSIANTDNPNFAVSAATSCALLPGAIPASLTGDIRTALSTGAYASCGSTTRVGGSHAAFATGYVTLDVVNDCGVNLPTNASYFTSEILFDNVLTGDFMHVSPNAATGNYVGVNPLVHIRAVPEGGAAGSTAATTLPYTFYDRLTPGSARRIDRRQPLPSTFAARYIQGGSGAFNTEFQMWREGVSAATAGCGAYSANSALLLPDTVRFDEHENPVSNARCGICLPERPFPPYFSPATASLSTAAAQFPPMSPLAGDVSGWMFVNLNHGGSTTYSAARPGFAGVGSTAFDKVRQSQNWIVVWMNAEGRFGGAFDATPLGNGCSPAAPVTSVTQPIAPAANVNP